MVTQAAHSTVHTRDRGRWRVRLLLLKALVKEHARPPMCILHPDRVPRSSAPGTESGQRVARGDVPLVCAQPWRPLQGVLTLGASRISVPHSLPRCLAPECKTTSPSERALLKAGSRPQGPEASSAGASEARKWERRYARASSTPARTAPHSTRTPSRPRLPPPGAAPSDAQRPPR